MKCLTIFFVLVLLLGGCGRKSVNYAAFFIQPQKNMKNITITSITLDTVPVILPNTSYMGFSSLMGEKIYFADKYFCWVYELDKNLQMVARHFGQGRGPGEIPSKNIAGYAVSQDGNHYFVNSTRNIYTFDSEYNLISLGSFIAKSNNSKNYASFERDDFYTLVYDNMIIKPYKGHLYFNVMGGDNYYNISNRDFYFNTRILMEVNPENEEIDRIFGRLSPSTEYMSAFWSYQYDVDNNGDFYLSFESDSLIYVYNNGYEVQYSFGYSGIDMNTDYLQLPYGGEYRQQYSIEREKKGYYSSLKKLEDYIFRTYRTGNNAECDRMQIYKGRMLIGDVPVPANFEVMGYIAPYYYSHIIADEYNETLAIYKFKLD